MGAKVSFLVFSEDGNGTLPAVKLLIKKLCQHVLPGLETQKISFEPSDDRSRHVLSGNRWKSRSQRDEHDIISLARGIATALAREDAFVFFHFDGDVPYKDKGTALNPQQFQGFINRIRQQLQSPPPRLNNSQPAAKQRSNDEISALLQKLVTIVPYYSLENWTYYNTTTLRDLCKAHENSIIDSWEACPADIEEIAKIFERISAGKEHNTTLTRAGFPLEIPIRVGKSFNDTAELIRANHALMNSLTKLSEEYNTD